MIDDGLGNWWYADVDGDGYGDVGTAIQTCTELSGHVLISGDCDDENGTVYPGAPEECDGIDNNCNGELDETGSLLWYADADNDILQFKAPLHCKRKQYRYRSQVLQRFCSTASGIHTDPELRY